jgi:hypothetical protein
MQYETQREERGVSDNTYREAAWRCDEEKQQEDVQKQCTQYFKKVRKDFQIMLIEVHIHLNAAT